MNISMLLEKRCVAPRAPPCWSYTALMKPCHIVIHGPFIAMSPLTGVESGCQLVPEDSRAISYGPSSPDMLIDITGSAASTGAPSPGSAGAAAGSSSRQHRRAGQRRVVTTSIIGGIERGECRRDREHDGH